MNPEQALKVTVGVTGGVAAYKAAELVRALQTEGLDPHVVMTRSAEEFIRPLTFAALTGHKVITNLWTEDATVDPPQAGSSIEHIAEAQSTRLLVVAPATANTLARFAQGFADDFLSTLYLATPAPVVLAPAMNAQMWLHPATQANVATLQQRGATLVPPEDGYLACGMTGGGRLAPIPAIVQAVLDRIHRTKDLEHETILITAGGTREPLDPVRYLGNRSSGKMGYALAEAALARGARVVLISAPTALAIPQGCTLIPVITAAEMQQAVLAQLPAATLVIAAAAVSDFRPAQTSQQKIKRNGDLTLTLACTEDIVQQVVAQRLPGTLVIAFAAETENLLVNARAKLQRKGADAIVANDVSQPHQGFESDTNAVTILTPTTTLQIPAAAKRQIAEAILRQSQLLRQSSQILRST